jgi:hypothetical protein
VTLRLVVRNDLSGIAAQNLPPDDIGLQFAESVAATAARLDTIIMILPIAGFTWRMANTERNRGSPKTGRDRRRRNAGSAQADGDAGMLGGIQPTQQIHLKGSRHLHAALRGHSGVDVDEER